jgi:hypothetical protein
VFTPRYSWNITKVGVKQQSVDQSINQSTHLPNIENRKFFTYMFQEGKFCFTTVAIKLNCYLWEWLLVYKSDRTSPIKRMQINQISVIERKGIYSNISEINKNNQYILYVLPLI